MLPMSYNFHHPNHIHNFSSDLASLMAGVWVFKNGVVRLVENTSGAEQPSTARRKVLVYTPANEVVGSYASLERRLLALGWERYYEDPDLLQFHKRSSLDLISLPIDFARFKSIHMYDIVVKNRDSFRVVDM